MTYTETVSFFLPQALLLSALAATAAAQTSPRATHAPAAAPAATAPAQTAATAPAPSPAANGIPPITGQPQPLYTLRYTDITIGTGARAEPQKFYTVRYTGWLTDGTKFDSSDDHPGKDPITFPYGARRVIAGWDTGFEGMHVGGKRRLFIPYQLAYGETGRPPIPPKADLVFDIELVSISDTPPPPPEPDPATPPPTGSADTPSTSAPANTSPPTKPETQPHP